MRLVTTRSLGRWAIHVGGLFSLWLAAGCSLLYDDDRKQCRSHDECASSARDVSYACEEGFCARAACTTDETCQARGARFAHSICGEEGLCASPECTGSAQCGAGLCDLGRGRCVAASAATCGSDAVCEAYDGAPICANGLCVARACTTAADCEMTSPTVECIAGRCEDATWGCRGQPDDRPASTQQTATLKLAIVDIVTRLPVAAVTARACRLPVFDPECTQTIQGTSATYTPEGGLVVTGLQQRTPFRLKLDFPESLGLAGVDYYSQKPVQDVVDAPPIFTIPFAAITMLEGLFEPAPKVDLNKTHLVAWAYDCQDRPASGVSLSVNEAQAPEAQTFYLDANALPAPGRASTDVLGGMGLINVRPNKLVNLSTSVGGTPLSQSAVSGFGRRLTVLNFYPRAY